MQGQEFTPHNVDRGMFEPMTRVLKPGTLGSATLREFEVTPVQSSMSALRRAYVPSGKYMQLLVNGRLVMSDTPMEHVTNMEMVSQAEGHVLIAGLGMGMVLVPLLRNPKVLKVTVLEISQDVIDLVEPQIRNYLGEDAEVLKVIQANVLEWRPPKGEKYDVVYFDIWPDICRENLKEMGHLHRKFGKRYTKWMGSWSRELLSKNHS